MPTVRYITTEELEQALREYGMQDGRDIKEILSEVDSDNVSKICIHSIFKVKTKKIHHQSIEKGLKTSFGTIIKSLCQKISVSFSFPSFQAKIHDENMHICMTLYCIN